MSEPIYKFFTGRFLPDWYQLSKEEQESLLAKLHEALEKTATFGCPSAKFASFCRQFWKFQQAMRGCMT
jgi:hypothetical protein